MPNKPIPLLRGGSGVIHRTRVVLILGNALGAAQGMFLGVALGVALGGVLVVFPAFAQDAQDAQPPESSAPAPATRIVHWGGGWHLYAEPMMRLEGPQARGQVTWQIDHPEGGWPQEWVADVSAADLRYTSQDTGTIAHVPGLFGGFSGLWRLDAALHGPSSWHAGLQLSMDWTDLRGTSSTGHLGYRRLGTKVWAMAQYRHADWGELQAGVLLRGRQLSWLSDTAGGDSSANIANTQKQGGFLKYTCSLGSDALDGWQVSVFHSLVARSDTLGRGGWYEPRNRTWQVSLQKRW